MPGRTVRAWWGENASEQADGLTSAGLETLLERLHREFAKRPVLVDLIDAAGDVLTIGVGDTATVTMFCRSSQDPPYLISVSDEFADESQRWFDHAGAESEFLPRNLISLEDGRRLAKSFVTSGDISGIQWEES